MGRKRIPKNQRRGVISISLKPSTIDLIDSRITHSQSRSVFVENLLIKALNSVIEDEIVEKPSVEEKIVTPVVTEKVIETPVVEREAIVKSDGNESPSVVNGEGVGVGDALAALSTLLTNLGLKEDAELVQKEGFESLNSVRRNLASHVGIEPRDMRVD